jgi:hypothetical protein
MKHAPKLSAVTRGYERSSLVKRGSTIVAEVFTDTDPGDQYETATLMAAAPELLAALNGVCNRGTSADFDRARELLTRIAGGAAA